MSHLIKWLKKSLARPEVTGVADQAPEPGIVRFDDIAEDSELGEDTLMPDIFADVESVTAPMLKIVGKPFPEDDESYGFNPYDTGVLQKTKGPKPR